MARVKMLSMSSVTPLPLVPSVIITQSGPISTTSTFTNRQLHQGYKLLILLSEAQSWSSSIHTKQLAVVFLVWIMTRKLLVTEPKLISIICLMQFRLAAMLSLQSELASLAYLMKEFMCFDLTPGPEQLSNLSRSFLDPTQRRLLG